MTSVLLNADGNYQLTVVQSISSRVNLEGHVPPVFTKKSVHFTYNNVPDFRNRLWKDGMGVGSYLIRFWGS